MRLLAGPFTLLFGVASFVSPAHAVEPPPAPAHAVDTPLAAPFCVGDYAEDLTQLAPQTRELEHQSYSYCVRNTATYECVAYGADGNLRRSRHKVVAHGTAFGYKRAPGETLLLTNEHVAEWPAVTDEEHTVDGVPVGCKRVADSLRIVDNEHDDYEPDDIPLARVVADPQLDAAVLRAKTALPIMPWKIGHSSRLRERDVVEVRGFPLGAFRALNIGKVISVYDHDDFKDWDHDDFVIDALLSEGNSGSPVLALSCQTGEFELVGLFHAGYSQGSALNVAIGIEQLRDLMTTLKRSPHPHQEATAALDEAARTRLIASAIAPGEPFFPLGPLAATVHSRDDHALVFEVFSHEFPANPQPIFVYEDLPKIGAFGDAGRVWFGNGRGLRSYARTDLDGDAQSQVARIIDAIRRDAIAFLDARTEADEASSRDQFESVERRQRTLRRISEGRKDLVAGVLDLADRLAPHDADARISIRTVFTPLSAAVATAPLISSVAANTPPPKP